MIPRPLRVLVLALVPVGIAACTGGAPAPAAPAGHEGAPAPARRAAPAPRPPATMPVRVVPVPRPAAAFDERSGAVVAAGLASPDYATRLVATEALGHLPPAVAVPALAHQLGDPDADVRTAAVLSLAMHDHAAARTLLASVRDDADEELAIRVEAAAALVAPPAGAHGTACR